MFPNAVTDVARIGIVAGAFECDGVLVEVFRFHLGLVFRIQRPVVGFGTVVDPPCIVIGCAFRSNLGDIGHISGRSFEICGIFRSMNQGTQKGGTQRYCGGCRGGAFHERASRDVR